MDRCLSYGTLAATAEAEWGQSMLDQMVLFLRLIWWSTWWSTTWPKWRWVGTVLGLLVMMPTQAESTLPFASPTPTITTLEVPPVPDSVLEILRPWQNVRSAELWGWWDDSILITTRFGEMNQLHAVRSPLGMRRQLSFLREPVAQVFPPPTTDAGGVVLLVDQGGSEFYQLLWQDMKDGSTRLLTDGRSRHGQVVWKPDASAFAYSTTERNGRDTDLHLFDLDGKKKVLLARDGETLGAEGFSADGKTLLVISYATTNAGELLALDLDTGQARSLVPSAGKRVRSARFGPLPHQVTFIGQFTRDFAHLYVLDLSTGEVRDSTPALDADVELVEISPDGQSTAYVVNDEGYSRLRTMGPKGAPHHAVANQPDGVITGLSFSADGSRLAFAVDGPTHPDDVYVYSLVEPMDEKSAPVRWTTSEVGGMDERRLVGAELIHFPSFDMVDGKPRKVPAFVQRPKGAGPFPVLILIHGGPEAQYRPQFSVLVQSLVATLGIAVVAPNVRGSDGYGQAWLDADNGFRREDSVRDIGALLDWITQQPELKADRVAVMGASYGGYMALASLVHFGDRLRAGVDRVGISNFVTFLENTLPYRRDLRRAEYGDERDPAMRKHLQAISPLTNVARLRSPLLISHGANDPRVPVAESLQIRSALAQRQIPAWYLQASDEGHGFRKKANVDYQAAVTWLFLKQHLIEEDE